MTPWLLGLTGGIGSGKSAAAAHFSALGVSLVDADDAARWVVEPGRPALREITQRFGDAILLPDGTLDRSALRQRVFEDSAQRRWLEELLHPLIRKEIQDYLSRATSPYAILVSPLLIESGQYKTMQRVLLIDVPLQLQLERSMHRDQASEEQIRAILKVQTSREERLRHADDVLLNDRDPAWLRSEVERLHNFYLTLKGGKP